MLGRQLGNNVVDLDIEVGFILRRPRDNQRCARLVDQDRVHLVDNRIMMIALEHLFQFRFHVVAQIVEPQLIIGRIGHIALICDFFLVLRHPRHNDTSGHPKGAVDRAHPFSVTFGQIIVDRDHMHTAPGQRVQVNRQCRHQGLALAGLHFRDIALMQEDTADELYVKMSQAN